MTLYEHNILRDKYAIAVDEVSLYIYLSSDLKYLLFRANFTHCSVKKSKNVFHLQQNIIN